MSLTLFSAHHKRLGVILIMALWILGLLSFLALNLNYRVRLGVNMTDYQQDQGKADCLLQAGLAHALWAIRQDAQQDIDYGGEPWAAAMSLESEGLLSLNYLD